MFKHKYLLIVTIVLMLLPMVAIAQTPTQIAYGQVVTGEISPANPADYYTFFGTQGDVLLIRMNRTAGDLDSFLRLQDPRGFDFYTDDDSGGALNALIGPITLNETGTYTLIASSCCDVRNSNTTGTYELAVEKTDIPSVALNQPIAFDLNAANPVRFFGLLSNDVPSQLARVAVNVTSGDMTNLNIGVEVRGPIGGYFYSNYIPAGGRSFVVDPVITDLSDGLYLIVVRLYAEDANTSLGAIGAEVVVNAVNATPIALNTPVSGTLNDANPTAYYSFTSQMGDILRLVAEQPQDSQAISAMLYAPGGISFSGGSSINYMDGSNLGSFVIDPLRTMNTGTYYLVMNRISYDGPMAVAGTTSAFTLTLSATDTPLLTPGVAVTGAFDNPNEYVKTFRYLATANQTIRITLQSLNAGYAPSMDFMGEAFESPDLNIANHNSAAPGIYTFEVTLYYDSVYIINVRNGIYFPMEGVIGEFSLQVDVVR